MRKTIITIIFLSVMLILGFVLDSHHATAFELGPFDASMYLRNQTWIRPWDGPDDLMQCRNEFNLELEYNKLPHVKFYLDLRPFYDAVFDLSHSGTGGGAKVLRKGWQDNFDWNNNYDPLIREVYADLTLNKWFIRLGKQQVIWGKSDGIYMLDIINPLCGRNPFVWETEDLKVPLWMINATYSFKAGDLQLLSILDYQAGTYPGLKTSENGYHDWTYHTVGLANSLNSLFFPYNPILKENPANTFKNLQWGVRWSGFVGGWSYTLNYLYAWSQYNDHPNTGNNATASYYNRRPDRLKVYGFSFDRYWQAIQGVTRLEYAYTKGQYFVKPDGNLEVKDQIGYMAGYDRYIFTTYYLSFQLQQIYIRNPWRGKNPYVGPGANKFDFNNFIMANGYIDKVRTNATCYVMNDFFADKTLHLESLFLWELNEGDKYWFGKLYYDVNTNWQVGIGANLFWGNGDDPLGEFKNNDNIFFMIKWGYN